MKEEKFGKITLINCDCMEYMRSLPDNAFEVAVVDPPYSDGLQENTKSGGGDSR